MTSIIIVCRNRLAYTRLCVRSVLKWTRSSFEMIFVDNGSTDGTGDFLSRLEAARVIRNGSNRGFSSALNQGIRAARGKFLLFLNNDVIVTPGYLGALIAGLNISKRVGAVSPTCNREMRSVSAIGNDKVPVVQCPPFYRDEHGLVSYAWAYTRLHEFRREPVSPASFSCFCHLVRREMVDRIGGMDEQFSPAYVEDVDFFFRAVKDGWRLLRVGSAYVHHFWRATTRGEKWEPRDLFERGKRRFARKWGPGSWKEAQKISVCSSTSKRKG